MPARLHVWGERACFARPEFSIDRVSYDVLTPLAARAMLEAIHWTPAIRWIVNRIHVLRPVRFERRERLAALVDPAYVIEGHFVMTDKAGPGDTPAHHENTFRRHAAEGRTFRPLRLGAQDFPAEFALLADHEPLPESTFPVEPASVDLGWMMHDIDFAGGKTARFFRAELVNGSIQVPPRDSPELAS